MILETFTFTQIIVGRSALNVSGELSAGCKGGQDTKGFARAGFLPGMDGVSKGATFANRRVNGRWLGLSCRLRVETQV
jgi:hypothetical protein